MYSSDNFGIGDTTPYFGKICFGVSLSPLLRHAFVEEIGKGFKEGQHSTKDRDRYSVKEFFCVFSLKLERDIAFLKQLVRRDSPMQCLFRQIR